jgi:polyisoprenoid-binding protein YceI
MPRSRPRRLALWLAGAAVAVIVLAVGGAFIYIHFISGPAPAPLSLNTGSPSASSPAPVTGTQPAGGGAGQLAGSWRVTSGSIVGYRVNEVLAGQNNVAAGRTGSIAGSMLISGTTVKSAQFTVQMATFHSDESQRDAQFNGRIMDTSTFPTGTLALTAPIHLSPVPDRGVVKTYRAAGNLTLHGRTRPVTFAVQAERTSSGLEVSGSIPIVFADWGIANPSFPPFVTTQNHGELEFLVKFRAG